MHSAVGILCTGAYFTCAVLAPGIFVSTYPTVYSVLFAKRVIDFWQTRDIWFLADYCYAIHACTILYLSSEFERVAHSLMIWGVEYDPSIHLWTACVGSAGNGVWAWRNTNAFDDVQRLTSTYLHLTPNILM